MSRFLLEPCKKFVEVIFFEQKVNFSEVRDRKLENEIEGVLEMLQTRLRVERVILLYGLEDGIKRTQEEVGRKFGVSREAIRLSKDKVIRRLRSRPAVFYLRPFVCDTMVAAEKALERITEFEELTRKLTEEEKNREALRGLFRERFPTLNIRYINRIEKSGITLFDITQLSEEELVKKLGVTSIGSYTEQVLLKLRWHLLAKQRAS